MPENKRAKEIPAGIEPIVVAVAAKPIIVVAARSMIVAAKGRRDAG